MSEMATQSPQRVDKEGLRKVVLRQYLNHEVKHHPPVEGGETQTSTVTPRAHGMADIYKLLHQGTFGYGPAAGVPHIPNRDFFIGHMTNEYFKAIPNPNEPVLEFVAPDDSIFRVNIRPFRALFRGKEREGFDMLADLVMDSSEIEKGSVKQFFATLKTFAVLNGKGELSIEGRSYVIPASAVNGFFSDIDEFIRNQRDLPVMGQSENYHRLVDPAYVVADLVVLKESPLAFLLDHTKEQMISD